MVTIEQRTVQIRLKQGKVNTPSILEGEIKAAFNCDLEMVPPNRITAKIMLIDSETANLIQRCN